MDENKDFLASEFEAENNAISDADTVNNVNTDENFASAFSEELADTQSNNENNPSSAVLNTTKKKRFLQTPILIVLVLVTITLLSFFTYKTFFNTSVVGTWTVVNPATADEVPRESQETTKKELEKTYYSFEKDNTVNIYIGTMKAVGTYAISENEQGTKEIEINTPTVFNGKFELEVSGNELFGRNLILSSPEAGFSITFESSGIQEKKLEKYENFKPNDKITGKWVYDDGFRQMSYEFYADGTAVINQSDTIIANSVYTVSDKTLTIKYYASEEAVMDISYEVKDNSLILNGIPFEKTKDKS